MESPVKCESQRVQGVSEECNSQMTKLRETIKSFL